MRFMGNDTTILWTEIADFPEGWGIKKHIHKDYYHLFYFIQGTGVFLIEDEQYPAKADRCFLLPPGVLHGLDTSEDSKLLSYEIKFKIEDPSLINSIPQKGIIVEVKDYIRSCVSAIQENGLSQYPEKRKAANYFLCALLSSIISEHIDDAESSNLIETASYTPATIKIIKYIEQNYMNHIYLDDIAKYVEYNRNYLCLLFKKDTGYSIIDYLNYVRIRKACEYIIYSDIGFSQISHRVGFATLSHFNLTFKKFVGTTPSDYSKLVDLDDNNLFLKTDTQATLSHFPSLNQALAALKIKP